MSASNKWNWKVMTFLMLYYYYSHQFLARMQDPASRALCNQKIKLCRERLRTEVESRKKQKLLGTGASGEQQQKLLNANDK
jgi:hypothetical protein